MLDTLTKVQPQYEPTWEIAHLFPAQGTWEEEEYLQLETNRRVEFDNGLVKVLDMPTRMHQRIIFYIARQIEDFVAKLGLGSVDIAGYRVKVAPHKYREPDVLFVARHNEAYAHELFTERADLVVEVVSSDRRRDFVTKRADYAAAGIAEYWIIDPRDKQIHVLVLDSDANVYVEHGVFADGRATSVLLNGFAVDVETVFSR